MAVSDAAGFWSVAERWPGKIAVIDHDGTAHTFGELRDRVNQISNLFTSAGMRSGDHAAYMLSNGVEVFAVSLSLLQIGVYYTPLNYHLTPDEIACVLRDSGARLFIGDAAFADRSKGAADRAQLSLSGRFAIGDVPTFVDIRRRACSQSAASPPDRTPGATLIYTSGTTGAPKGILRPRPRTFEDAATVAEKGAKKYGWTSDVTYLVQGPLYHSG
ncbi:MAG: AMP-binding protein, partial [Gemmatimonas sp.]